ncbi:regulatory protein RecX [Adlercreutzia sp. ZJ138]|uniref:regulatory protein RecX n=1 Tax=Adlercreutzia sp. ZJ138 TaxID=2709405 RepID=UPI0013ED31D1|nr:regulatory protein RecX [Adlercreutzia sp. ZJ138]
MANNATIEELRARIAAMESGSNHYKQASITRINSIGKGVYNRQSCNTRSEVSRKAERTYTEEDAFRRITRVSVRREQSTAGMLRKLEHEGFSSDVAHSAVDRAVRCGLLDDTRFADVLVRSRLAQGKGRAGIARELESEDIDPATVEAFAETDLGDSHEFKRARTALLAHPPRSKNQREGAYRFLMRKGFDSHISAVVAREWSEQSIVTQGTQ